MWDTTYTSPGDYSLQLVARDIHTGLQAVAEVILTVSSEPMTNSSIPRFITSSDVLLNNIIYATPGTSVTKQLTVEDSEGVEELSISPLSPLPVGMSINMMQLSLTTGTVLSVIAHLAVN